MKNAANCAKHGELQGFMKPLLVERILQPWLTGQGCTHLRVEEPNDSSGVLVRWSLTFGSNALNGSTGP